MDNKVIKKSCSLRTRAVKLKAGRKPAPILSLFDIETTKTMLKNTTFFQGEEIEVWDIDENGERVDRVDVVVKIEEVLKLKMDLFDGCPADGDKSVCA